MPQIPRSLSILVLACAAFGQEAGQTQVFRFLHTQTPVAKQELVNAIRSVTGLEQVAADKEWRALTVQGPANEAALSKWLFGELDWPQGTAGSGDHEYRVAGSKDPVVRVFYLAHTAEPAAMQELVNVIRTVGGISRVSPCLAPQAVVARGTADRIALAAWLIGVLDRPRRTETEVVSREAHEYQVPGERDNLARVFFTTQPIKPGGLQEIINVLRTAADLNFIFPVSSPQAVAVRATAEHVALAAWLFDELDQPPVTEMVIHEQPANFADDPSHQNVVHAYHLVHADLANGFQKVNSALRSETGSNRVFLCPTPRVLVVRSTASGIALADRIVFDWEKASRLPN